jgi:hypothetical protein
MARPKKDQEITQEQQNIIIEEAKQEEPHSIQVNSHIVSTPKAEVEKVMPTVMVSGKKVFPTDYKFNVDDEIEVHGLPECKEYLIIGKIAKQLDNYTYAVHGHSYLLNKKAIGHDGPVVRTFKEVNLRKATIVHKVNNES